MDNSQEKTINNAIKSITEVEHVAFTRPQRLSSLPINENLVPVLYEVMSDVFRTFNTTVGVVFTGK